MSGNSIDYERLIARRLDGVITDEEMLSLDRELLRDPELRRTLEAYERIDALSADALLSAVGTDPTSVDLDAITSPARTLRMRRAHRGWFLIPGAIAAALLALVVPMPDFAGKDRPIVVNERPSMPMTMERPTRPVSVSEGLLRNVNTTKRSTGRDVIGVIDEDGNVYWIEVDRTRTIRVPPRSRFATDQQL